ncbi:hypothetical protein [Robiginitomaculum antarcticum]|uniref:hypothetical protein n=1 Tax=Robiginitomaculum antarcticum TaxID=437507 RepID=UPI0003603937|nr:hypothetical protein [Robiginitomaculum antarcticum]
MNQTYIFPARICLSALIIAGCLPIAAYGQDLRGDPFCFPAKGVGDMVERLENIDADRRDVVDVNVSPRFIRKDGGPWPERFYIRDGEDELDIAVEKPSGATPSFMSAVRAHESGDICIADSARASRPADDEGLYFEMGLSPIFNSIAGRHDMAALKEGSKDAKVFYQQMIPMAFRLLMPDPDYYGVKYEDKATPPQIFVDTAKGEVPVSSDSYRDMHIVSMDQIRREGGSALIVRGGAYTLQPTPSIATMKRFGYGQDTEK